MNAEAQIFREKREALGWTQRRAADELGVTQAAVWNWEQGRRRIPSHYIAQLDARALEAAAAADPLDVARAKIAQLEAELEDARLDAELAMRGFRRWEARALAAELKIAQLEAERAARDAQARKVWEEFNRARPAAPSHAYSAADLRDLAELGLDERATWEAIKQAGKAAAQRHHPDKGGNGDDFTRTRAAFDRLRERHHPKQQGAA